MARPDETESESEPEPVDAEFEAVEDSEGEESETRPGPARRGPGWVLFVVFIILTAVIAAGVAWALTRYLGPGPEAGDVAALQSRLAALEETRPEAALEARIESLQDRIADLETQTARIEEIGSGLEALRGRVEALEARPAGETASLPADLSERLDELSATAGQALQIARNARQGLESLGEGEGAQQLSAAIDRLRSDIEALRGRMNETRAALSAEDEALAGAVSAVGESVGEIQARLSDLSDQAGRALELARSAQSTAGGETAALRQLSARALGLAALSEAASRSGPFEAERAALARVWRGQSDLAALESIARAGAPTRAELVETFPGEAIRDAAGEARSFWGLLEVRPAEAAEGEGPSAIAARAEARLERGDLAGAVDAVAALEGAPAEAAADWLRNARARLEIERRLDALRSALSAAAAEEEARP